MDIPAISRPSDGPSVRAVLRIVVTVIVSLLAMYLMYVLRRPLGWLVVAVFVAAAASVPVSAVSRRLPRGVAIGLVYLGIALALIGVGAALAAPVIKQTVTLVDRLPSYAQDLSAALQNNDALQNANDEFQLSEKIENLAADLAANLGDTAGTLATVGASVVSSLFALITILVLSMFMVARGPRWRDAFIATRPASQHEALRRGLDRMTAAVAGYVGGALAQAAVAGAAAFGVLVLLGVPYPLPLALVIAVLDLIPLVGATLGAIVVGVVTVFSDFPVTTIVWTVFAIVYQQFENYVVQPRIQSRAAHLDSFVVIVAALFGGTLFGIVGALLAIPSAAAIQIAVREYLVYRRDMGTTATASSDT